MKCKLYIYLSLTLQLICNISCGQIEQKKKQKQRPTQEYRVSNESLNNKSVTDTPKIEQLVTITESKEGLVLSRKGNKFGYTNMKGEVVIAFDYDFGAGEFSEGLAFVRKENKLGFINTNGEIVIPFKFHNVSNFNNGLAMVEINNKYGYINKRGEYVIALKYEDAREFSFGLAAVKLNNKYGYIDTSGNVTLPFKYIRAGSFQKNRSFEGRLIAHVSFNGAYLTIDTNGNILRSDKLEF